MSVSNYARTVAKGVGSCGKWRKRLSFKIRCVVNGVCVFFYTFPLDCFKRSELGIGLGGMYQYVRHKQTHVREHSDAWLILYAENAFTFQMGFYCSSIVFLLEGGKPTSKPNINISTFLSLLGSLRFPLSTLSGSGLFPGCPICLKQSATPLIMCCYSSL